MKKLLKYIILSILALVLYDSAKDDSSYREYEVLSDFQVEHFLEDNTILSSPHTDFCLPRQSSTLNAPRVQNNGRKQDSSSRQNFEFIKSVKTIYSGLKYIVWNKSSDHYFTILEPGHKLVSLCRFII